MERSMFLIYVCKLLLRKGEKNNKTKNTKKSGFLHEMKEIIWSNLNFRFQIHLLNLHLIY